jgi:hypothetical protein
MRGDAATRDPELLSHLSVLIYPFRHDIRADNGQARAAALAPRWAPGGRG